LGTKCAVATAGEPGEILFLSRKQRTISPISRRPNFTKFQHNTSIGVAIKISEQNFENFILRGRFSEIAKKWKNLRFATLGRHNSAMITDRRKFTTKITLYGISSFHFYRWNQFKVIPLGCTIRGLTTPQITLTSISRRQPITMDC